MYWKGDCPFKDVECFSCQRKEYIWRMYCKNISRKDHYIGEVVMLVKSELAESISQEDTNTEGQIWVVLSW